MAEEWGRLNMKIYEASETAYKNGYELGEKVKQEKFAEQFIKGFNEATAKERYAEIIELYDYCKKIGVDAELVRLYDGYKILFKNGGDVIQHKGSYGNGVGCVEPAIESRVDYTAVTLKQAKSLIYRHRKN